MKITVPSTMKEAAAALGDLEELVTAKEWHRAAIVYAFTYDGGRGGDRSKPRARGLLNMREFAGRGISGLRTEITVAHYRNSWKAAILAGKADDIQPGDRVTLPEMDWPKRADATAGTERSAAAASKDPQVAARIAANIASQHPTVFASVIANDPGAARAVAQNPRAAGAVHGQGAVGRPGISPGEAGRAAENSVSRAMGRVDRATEELHQAARHILIAKMFCDDFGIEDGDAESEAIERIKRNLRTYENRSSLTSTDREWAAANGIEVA